MRGLFVGIGGTGDWILALLKDKVYASLGGIPDTLQFRLVDTESEDARRTKGARLQDTSEIAIGTNEYLQLKDEPPGTFYHTAGAVTENPQSHPELSGWFKAKLFKENLREADFNLTDGAGQHRQFARIGAFLNKDRIVTMLRRALDLCRSSEGKVPIWIIGSVAGGTGAGLLDMAVIARWVAQDMGVARHIIGVWVLPEVFHDVRIDHARAYAVMRELERFQSPVAPDYEGRGQGGGFRFSVSYGGGMTLQLRGTLFDNLVFYNRKCENNVQRRSYFSEIADGLNLLLDESVSTQLFGRLINVNERYAASFNSYRVFLPALLYSRQFVLEAALNIVETLLTRDQFGALVSGSVDDRRKEAADILGKENMRLFRDLLMKNPEKPELPPAEKDFETLSKEMTSEYIVNQMLGFANPAGVFGKDIGESRQQSAKRLYMNVFAEIDRIDRTKEGFEDSKSRIKAEVVSRRRQYWGDASGGFVASLESVRQIVEDNVRGMLDESFRRYMGRYGITEQGFGRTNRMLVEVKKLLVEARNNLERLIRNDGIAVQENKGRETDDVAAIDHLKKRILGGKSQLAELEYSYLDAVWTVERCEQRQKLCSFLKELIVVADEQISRWLEGLQRWQKAVEDVINNCRNEHNELSQRLERQTKIESASMGFKNDTEMDGYRKKLIDQCVRDLNTGEYYVPMLLKSLRWRPGKVPQELYLEGWPGRNQELDSQSFRKALFEDLEGIIGTQMRRNEGMAAYLQWLRDEKKDNLDVLADHMMKVTEGFVDGKQAPHTRKSMFLHGEEWIASLRNQSENAFDRMYNRLHASPNLPGLVHNLAGPDGINMFKDPNVIAILMLDDEIPYQEIPVIKNSMRPKYLEIRGQSNPDPEWRVFAYHLFRCDQEAWQIERDMVFETGHTDYPIIPGEYSRLLDEPEWIQRFVEALAVGVVRGVKRTTGEHAWVCGLDSDDRKLIYLTDPEDRGGAHDLHRALVTFVMDRRDRRGGMRGQLDLRQVRAWIEQKLDHDKQTLDEAVEKFRKSHPQIFDIPIDVFKEAHSTGGTELRNQAFHGLILHYYLIRKK